MSGDVKASSSIRHRALGEERQFALVDDFRFPAKGSLAILAVRNSVRPNHLFDPNFDRDYYFELPGQGEWDAQSFQRWSLQTLAISGLSHVRTELFELLVVPSLAPHPVQSDREVAGHFHLSDPAFPSYRHSR